MTKKRPTKKVIVISENMKLKNNLTVCPIKKRGKLGVTNRAQNDK